ncbi:MAG: NYN domain-containing protein [Comamonadaceae bacterium]|nr:MAG: NYN domain-containing protein [Comamonadaceae bacterium]
MNAFFIDADNLCSSPWVDEAFRLLEASEGPVSLRRAYGSAEKLKGLAEVLRTRLIRPYLNLSLSKNTTDVALAIDVMETSYATPRPTCIAIGSGDADFVPLVLRLRERGFRVLCISQKGKMAPEAMDAYDKVIFVGAQDSVATEPAPAAPRREEAAAVPAAAVAPSAPRPRAATAKKAPAKKAAAKKPAAAAKSTGAAPGTPPAVATKKAPARKSAAGAKKTAAPTETAKDSQKPVTVAAILEHIPSLRSGHSQPLGDIVKLLHDAKLLGKNTASPKLFNKFPQQFELTPARQPNKVRYIPPPR